MVTIVRDLLNDCGWSDMPCLICVGWASLDTDAIRATCHGTDGKAGVVLSEFTRRISRDPARAGVSGTTCGFKTGNVEAVWRRYAYCVPDFEPSGLDWIARLIINLIDKRTGHSATCLLYPAGCKCALSLR